ncbi:MAG: rhomboid family intramembrane serine protease [Phycisphaerales bacterium]|nr:rhomboid family intramembrane serine protease [Phycisphaerales bacterium]
MSIFSRPSSLPGRAHPDPARPHWSRSFNTWLIILNITVFVFNNVLFRNVVVRTDYGTFDVGSPTPEQRQRALPKPSRISQVPGDPRGMLVYQIVDPDKFYGDEQGIIREVPIGIHRFRYEPIIHSLGHFSTARALLWRGNWSNTGLEVWRFVTFQFLHYDITHLLFNMLGLLFFGRMVEERLGARRFGAFYLTCGIFGALLYLVLNVVGWSFSQMMGRAVSVPLLLFSDPYTPLIGASAGVFGVLIAAAHLNPREMVSVFFIIPMRLRTAVIIFTGLAAVNLIRGGPNAGGDAAHIGGALAGAFFVRRTHLLRDFFQVLGPYRGTGSRELNRIMNKARQGGVARLSRRERELLSRARESA